MTSQSLDSTWMHDFTAYVQEINTYFQEHGATDTDDLEYLQRLTNSPSPCLLHETPEYWFDQWLAHKYPKHPSLKKLFHRSCRYNRVHISPNSGVGCFTCIKIFDGGQIHTYINDTAQCPHCSNLTVIVNRDHTPVTLEILKEIHDFWLNGSYKLNSDVTPT
jgi:DNA-directed RNA polymerase subunit RPC12/RpoP